MSAVPAMPAVAQCRHCGARMEGDDPYCCAGCAMAAEIIAGAGVDLVDLESRRLAFAPRPGEAAGNLSQVEVTSLPNGLLACALRIDGLQCASCTFVAERVIAATPGVSEAIVSYGTGRARVVFDPTKTSVEAIGARVAAVGYKPVPVTSSVDAVDRELLVRLGIAAFCSSNIMLSSAAVYAGWFDGMELGFAALLHWTSLVLATPVALFSAEPFVGGAIRSLKHRVLGMDVPIALGVVVMYVHGVWATLHHEASYLDSLAMLVTLLLIGRVLEARGRRHAREAAEALADALPRHARRVSGSTVVTVPVEDLRVDDRVEVGLGEEVPADGIVEWGRASVRMALVTGESEPILVLPGDRVVAGAMVAEGTVRVRAEATGGSRLIDRMAEELRAAADRPAARTPIDTIAPWFVGATLLAALATFFGHLAFGGLAAAIPPTVAVLVVACPCALALAQPLAIASGLGAAARRGLLVRSGDALLALADIDVVALDKTGTVTLGVPRVTTATDEVVRLASGLARHSVHPVSRAIVEEAARRGLPLAEGNDVVEVPGTGLTGVVDRRALALRRGLTGVAIVEGDLLVGEIALADAPRPDAASAVAALTGLGMRVEILSGDRLDAVARVAEATGVASSQGAVGPEAKAAIIRGWQANGARVLFVGDGLNDGLALAAADVGIAMATGARSSLLAADGLVSTEAIGPLVAGLRAAAFTRRAIRSNIVRSLMYNICAVTAAAFGFVNPLVAAILMPLSSTLVVLGATSIERRMRAK